jgi:hypothetical protein
MDEREDRASTQRKLPRERNGDGSPSEATEGEKPKEGTAAFEVATYRERELDSSVESNPEAGRSRCKTAARVVEDRRSRGVFSKERAAGPRTIE